MYSAQKRNNEAKVFHLSKSRPLALRLNGDGVGSSLEDLVYVFLTEFGTFIFLIHQSSVCPLPQQVLNLFLRQLLDLENKNFVSNEIRLIYQRY